MLEINDNKLNQSLDFLEFFLTLQRNIWKLNK